MGKRQITQQTLFRKLRKYVCNNDKVAYIKKLSDKERINLALEYADRAIEMGRKPLMDRIEDDIWECWDKQLVRYEFEEDLDEGNKNLLRFYREVVMIFASLNRSYLTIFEVVGCCKESEVTMLDEKVSGFIEKTKYINIALEILRVYTYCAMNYCMEIGYQPGQDYLAELRHITRGRSERAIRGEIKEWVTELKKLEKHIDEGMAIGLTEEEIITHDEIYGFVMDRYESTVLPVAKRISEFINEEMPKFTFGYNVMEGFYDQSEELKQQIALGVERVGEKVREIREKEFGGGWLEDDSISFSYLMDHALRVAIESANKRGEE